MTTQPETERENLRAIKMASQSPRTFWSIVKHFGGDVEAGLKKLLPRLDWYSSNSSYPEPYRSFLDHRTRRQSERAKKSESSKQTFNEAKKMYKQELQQKMEIRNQIEEALKEEVSVEEVTETKTWVGSIQISFSHGPKIGTASRLSESEPTHLSARTKIIQILW